MRAIKTSLALTAVAALALAGCGKAPSNGVFSAVPDIATSASAATANMAVMPSVDAILPSVNVAVHTSDVRSTGVTVTGLIEVSDREWQIDADGQTAYHLQDALSGLHVTGYVRRTEGHDFALEATHNEQGKKEAVNYTLVAPDEQTYTWLGLHVNKRVNVKGLFGPHHMVAVTFADGALDFSFLGNWLTKGKLKGQAFSVAGLPLVNTEVKLRDPHGFVFLANSDDVGSFTLPNLAPGAYQITFSKSGYGSQSSVISIAKHKATVVEGVLAHL
jgi:hypothetical protein